MNDVPDLGVGEVIAAVVGLRQLLTGARPLTVEQQRLAEVFPRRLRRATLRMLSQDAAEPSEPEKFDFDEVNQLLSSASDRQSKRILDVYPPDLAHPTVLVVGRLLDLLHAALPRTVTPGLVSSEVSGGSPEAMRRFRVLWQVALDPLSVLHDLTAGHVTGEKVTALETLYPTLYTVVVGAVTEGLRSIKAERPRWRPQVRRERQLRTLLQQDVGGGLGAVMTAVYADERAKEAVTPAASRAAPGAGGSGVDVATPGQRLG